VKVITSRQHPLVRRFRTLAERPDRAGARLLLDGAHLVSDARAAGLDLEIVAVAKSHLDSRTEAGRLAEAVEHAGGQVVAVPDRLLPSLSPLRTPSGIVAIALRRPDSAGEVCQHPRAFIIAAIDVQDPGNVGALIRVAEACGATGALVCGASANPFSWKAVRGSMGSALRLPVASGLSAEEALQLMQTRGVRTVGAVARGGVDPDTVDWRGRLSLVLGGEGPGLSEDLTRRCESLVTIPMAPPVESLNVAVAGAVLAYAARRQRTAV
jgi:RNA methyltransferase, TrmH family